VILHGRQLQTSVCKPHRGAQIPDVPTMWSMSFRGGTVGMPSNGKSMVAISSNTSACAAGHDETGACRIVSLLLLLRAALSAACTSFSGGISRLASQSQAPFPRDTASVMSYADLGLPRQNQSTLHVWQRLYFE